MENYAVDLVGSIVAILVSQEAIFTLILVHAGIELSPGE